MWIINKIIVKNIKHYIINEPLSTIIYHHQPWPNPPWRSTALQLEAPAPYVHHVAPSHEAQMPELIWWYDQSNYMRKNVVTTIMIVTGH